ncbi:MAG: Holliday junction resolvase RuvX [Cyanobacteria bacterium REEB459]|nr:Holliday junction resolvase RuvX [Cyanobacteria bacterium REEB459]
MVRREISALGLDIGRQRIGVAGCDRTGLIATGLTTLRRQPFIHLLTALEALILSRRVEILVVGLPLTMAGTEGSQARDSRRLGDHLGRRLGLPVTYVDERLSSLEAEELIRQQGGRPSQDKNLIDRKAAAIILQRWLDQQ